MYYTINMNTMLLSGMPATGSFEFILLIVSTILILPAILFALWAQFSVMSNFNRYSQEFSSKGMTGAQVARQLLDQNGCGHVRLEQTNGRLSDHYDPRTKVVRLSHDVFHSSSISALGVAAHEVGHAIQDQTNYPPLKIRQLVIRTTRLVNFVLLPLIVIGFLGMFLFPLFISESFFFYFVLALAILYGISFLINVITLPTEIDASRRAKRILEKSGIMTCEEEQMGVSRVLRAAAMTYVASLIISLVYLLRFIAILLIMRGGNRR